MDRSDSTMARQFARAASAFEQQRTGHAPKSVTVVLSEDTLVIRLQGALAPAEKALAHSPAGAAQTAMLHLGALAKTELPRAVRGQLFDNDSGGTVGAHEPFL
jgi:uncharacterized protein YbcI